MKRKTCYLSIPGLLVSMMAFALATDVTAMLLSQVIRK